MAVTLALNGAVGADVTEVAAAYVGFHTCASYATLCARGHANVSANYTECLRRILK